MLYDKKWDKPIVAWRELILRGADLIQKQGLCKHTARNTAGEHCISGALQDAGGIKNVNAYFDALEVLNRAAQKRGWETVVRFNNAPLTTKADVVAFMQEVAAE